MIIERINVTNMFIKENNLTSSDIMGNITRKNKHVPVLKWYGVYWHFSHKQVKKIKGWIDKGKTATELGALLLSLVPEGSVTKALAMACKVIAVILIVEKAWLELCEYINNNKGVKARFIFATRQLVVLP